MTMVKTDEQFWREVPSLESEPGEGFEPAPPQPGRFRASRRVTLQAVSTLGGAFALNVLSWLPPFKAPPAQATVGNEYTNCAGYDNWAGYNNNSAVCVGAPYGSGYCGSDGWFLQYSGTCFVSGAVKACGDDGLTARNAWRWTHSSVPYRCADGHQYWCGGDGFFICSKARP